jgi:PAS domain S-box-containing protein
VDDVLPGIIKIAHDLVAADGYSVWRLDLDGDRWQIVSSHGISRTFADHIVTSYRPDGVSTVPFSEPLVVEDVQDVPLLDDRRAAYRAEGIQSMLAVPLVVRGEPTGTLVFYYRERHVFGDVEIHTARALGNLAATALTTAELYDEQRRHHERAQFLAQAGSALGSALDYEVTLKAVAGLAVPTIADWCAVDIVGDGGELRRLAVAHIDLTKVELARTLRERYPDDTTSPYGVYQVIRTGESVMMSTIPKDLLTASARDPEQLRLIGALGLTSYMCVPLLAHGRTLGALTFVTAESHRHYSAADLRFGEQVAARAALAVANARAYDETRRLAETLRMAQSRVTQLLESVPGIVWETWVESDEVSQHVDFVSNHVERMLGYSVDEWLQSKDFWLSAVHPEDREHAADVVGRALASGQPFSHRFRWLTKDGHVLWVETRAVIIHDDQGKSIGVRGVTVDITDRKEAEVALSRATAEAEQANRLKDEFLATLSHELRTPLNAVLGYARMLRTGSIETDRQARALEVLERNATSLSRIVEDVLDVSRIITGKTRLDVQPVELVSVIDHAMATVRPAAEAKGVRLQAVLDQQAPPVSGDPDRLQQVIWNLLANAVKFTTRGGRVQIQLARVNSHIEIVVSDTGIGIAPEFLPHVFDRFRQADSRFTRQHGGLGLGLAICRHLIELHGGLIHATSDGEGLGSTFRVELPTMIVHADRVLEAPREHPRTDRSTIDRTPGRLNGIHVLAVDDESDALTLLREILQQAGAHVTTSSSAAEVLDAIQMAVPDVLITDIGMPEIDGFELIRRIRQSPDRAIRHIPAAALTAYARSEDRTRTLRSGFQMHLSKPIDPSELVAAVEALVGRGDLSLS